jgi:leucyl aminopeptidase (aminopeptidase T)
VVDRTLSAHDYKMLDEPIVLTVKGGNVVDIQGGLEARRLARWFVELASPGMYHVTELSFGTNPRCSPDRRGYVTEDTHALGTASLALGSDRHWQGNVQAPAHCDMTMRSATFELDGTVVVEDGRLLL